MSRLERTSVEQAVRDELDWARDVDPAVGVGDHASMGPSPLSGRSLAVDHERMVTQPDDFLRRRIRHALALDPALDAFEIDVEVADGITRLCGVVGSYAERLEAVALARRLTAGREVVDEMTVRPYGELWRLRDEQISDDVRRRLGVALIESGDVDFTVDHHVVTLTGRVPTARERALVRHVVETTPGVDFVDNRIALGRP